MLNDFDHYLLDHLPWFSDQVNPDNPALPFLRKGLTTCAAAATLFGLLYRKEQDKIGAAMIACLGLLDEEISDPWGYAYVCSGLVSDRPDMRRAAVSTLRRWGSKKAWTLLTTHQDEEPDPDMRREIDRAVHEIERESDYSFI